MAEAKDRKSKKHEFLPVSRRDMKERGWDQCDFVYVTGDAYVDHSSFGMAIISRHLEAHGYRVGIIPSRIGGMTPALLFWGNRGWDFW